MTSTPAISFFDLDRTLLSVNSASLWIRREMALGFLHWSQALRGAFWLGLYRVGFGEMNDAIRAAVATLAGAEESAIRARTSAFWESDIRDRVRPGARRAIAQRRLQGDRIVMLTSSSPYLSELAAEALGIDDVLCNRFEVDDGVFTGEVVEPLCFGAGKIEHARRYAADLGIPLERCAFYTDSFSDVPLLDVVGEPVAVHPDPRLMRMARRRNWQVVHWDAEVE